MHRNDNSKYLLYIEPLASEKSAEPIMDDLTHIVILAMGHAVKGVAHYSDPKCKGKFRQGSGYKGRHTTDCGERSTNNDYLLENGLITNFLAPFYVMWYRDSIGENDMLKLKDLKAFYEKTNTKRTLSDLTKEELEKLASIRILCDPTYNRDGRTALEFQTAEYIYKDEFTGHTNDQRYVTIRINTDKHHFNYTIDLNQFYVPEISYLLSIGVVFSTITR